jgi:hypothetical protein
VYQTSVLNTCVWSIKEFFKNISIIAVEVAEFFQ